MERGVEPSNFWDHVDFPRVVVPTLNAKHHAIHHLPQSSPVGEFVRRIQAKEMTEIASFYF
jgi:hypothetical protein